MKRSMAAFVSVALITMSCGGRLLEDGTGSNTNGSAGDAGGTSTSTPPNLPPPPPPPPLIDASAPLKDASITADAASSAGGKVTCNFGAVTCDAKQGEQCCVYIEPGKVVGAACVTGNCAPGDGQFAEVFACDGPEDCSNSNICCAYRAGGSACDKSEACDLNTDHLQLCHNPSDCQALAGTTCCLTTGNVVPSGICQQSCN